MIFVVVDVAVCQVTTNIAKMKNDIAVRQEITNSHGVEVIFIGVDVDRGVTAILCQIRTGRALKAPIGRPLHSRDTHQVEIQARDELVKFAFLHVIQFYFQTTLT